MHWGPYQKIPDAAAAKLDDGRRWYESPWVVFLPFGIAALLIFPIMFLPSGLFEQFAGLALALRVVGLGALCAAFLWLTYRTWYPR